MASRRSKASWIGFAASLALHAFVSSAWGTTSSWTNASGGVWSNPSNWDSGVPGASDDAVITLAGTYSVTLDVDASVTSLTLGGASGTQTLSGSGRTLTLGGASTVNANGALTMSGASTVGGAGTLTNAGTLTLTSSTVSAPLSNQGTLIAQGTSSANGVYTSGTESTLRVQGSSAGSNATLTVASGFTNNGTVELTSTGGGFSASLIVTSGTLVNASGRTISVLVGAGGPRTLTAELDNQGTLSVGAALTIGKASADHANSGTIDVSGGNLTLNQSGATPTFTNSGSLTIAAGRTMSVVSGELIYNGGSVSGGGTLSLSSLTATLNAGLSNSAVTLSPSSVVFSGAGTLTNAASQTLTMTGTTVNAPLDNQGVLVAQGNTSVNGSFTFGSGSTLRILGNSAGSNATLTVASGFTNNGTVELTTAGGAFSASLTVTSGTLVNPPGATISVLAGSLGPRTLTAELDNQGTLSLGTALTISKASAHHSNSGTIDVSGGSLTVSQSGTAPTFTNSGALTIAASQTMSVSSGEMIYNGGALSGGGTLSLSSMTATLNAGLSNTAVTLNSNTVVFNGPGALTNAASQTLTMTSATVNAPLDNQGVLIAQGNTFVNGSFTIGAGTTLRILGNNTGSNSFLTVASGFTNNGTVELTSANAGYTASLTVTSGTLVNPVGRTISVLAGSGGPRTLTAELDNQGLLSVGTALGINKASADHANSGTIDISGGNLTLSQSGTTPTFTNSGSLTIAASRTMTVSGGELIYNGGAVSGGGTLSLSSMTTTLNAGLSNAVVTLISVSVVFNGPATLTSAASQTLTLVGCTVNAPLDNQGVLIAQGNTSVNGSFTIGAGTTLRILGNNTGSNSFLTVANGFTNNGTVELTTATGAFGASLTVTTGTLVNPPGRTISVLAGSGGFRTLTAELDNQGTLSLGIALTINKASADHANSGTIDMSGGNLTLSQSGTTPTFTNSGSLTIAASRTMTVSGGELIYNGGAVSGGGTLALSSMTTTLNAGLSNAIVALSASSVIFNGSATLTNAASQTLTLLGCTVNTPLDNQGVLIAQGNTSVNASFTIGAGTTLRILGNNTGSNSFLTVANGFTNNGTVELTSATGAFSASLAVTTGTLVNPVGRTISVLAGAAGPRTLTAELDNQGTLSLGTALTINKASADHVNGGTIDVSGGTLTLSQSGTTPTFTNSGSLTIAASRTMTVSGGELIYNGGLVSGGGTLSLSSLTATLNVGLSNAGVTLGAASTTFNGPGSLTNVSSQSMTLTGCTVNTLLDNQGALIEQGTGALNGVFASGSGSSLRVQGSNAGSNAFLTVASGFTNNGRLELTSVGGGFSASLTVTNGTLVNALGRAINALAGAGGARTLTTEIDNQGTLSVGTGVTINKGSAHHLNSGAIDVSGGNLTLTQSGTTPSFTNFGTLTLSSGRTMTATSGTVTNSAGGLIRGAGTLDVNTSSFSNAGTISPGVSPAILSVTGGCPFTSTAALEIEIAGLTPGTQYDRLAVSGTASLGGALNVSFLPGYCAAPGDSFRVLTAGVRSGTFSGVNILGEGNAVLDAHYDATGLTLLTVSNNLTITASAGPGGTISPSGAMPVSCGSSPSFTITPDACYQIADVLVDGLSVGPVPNYTFTNVTDDHTISATFALGTYTIDASAGPGGSITPAGAVGVGCGTDQSFTITPGTGFQLVDVLVDGGSVGAVTDYTFTNVLSNHTIAASFADVQPPAVQVVMPNGGEILDSNSTQVVRWTASDNASVDSVNVDYSLHGADGPWLPIQHAVAGVDSVQWAVPEVVGTDSAMVRVTAFDPSANSAEDLSDAPFRLRGPTDAPIIVGQPTLALALAPNPSRGGPVHLRVSMPDAGEAAVEVFSVTGQRVWNSRIAFSAAGARRVDWSGQDSRGRMIGPGVYLVRLQTPWGEKTSRLVLLR